MRKSNVIMVIACVVLLMYGYVRSEDQQKWFVSPINHPDVLAVEKMIDDTGANVKPLTKKKVALAIAENARYYKIQPEKLVAIAYVESRFDPNAYNKPCDDVGLMQINWPTWKNRFTRNKSDLFNIYKNVEVACKIIAINRQYSNNIATYHSFTPEFRDIYSSKLKNVLRRM